MQKHFFNGYEILEQQENRWLIPSRGAMRVPGKVIASRSMMKALVREQGGLQQVINVATLPGIQKYSIAMPDIHWGYGFPIGGVAAMDVEEGVISPGGVGYDINCGVRLISSDLQWSEVKGRLKELVIAFYNRVPTGVGSSGALPQLRKKDIKRILKDGAKWAVESGYGKPEDLLHTEENGTLSYAEPNAVSVKAVTRGEKQVGTLGSGNHFLEVQRVDEIYDEPAAKVFGLRKDQIVIMIHSGSRGLGHQVCEDHLRIFANTVSKYHISIPDPQLACAPVRSPEGKGYLGAMAAAANFAWANRQVMNHFAKETLQSVFAISERDLNFNLIYDVCHNIAKIEKHQIDGKDVDLCVHRKGATRAFPPFHPMIPEDYRETGQPVIIPGDMGRYSFLAVGQERAMEETFGSSCHGAGRMMSRHKALKQGKNRDLFSEMESLGVYVQARGRRTMAEEMPYAYKDVAEVVKIINDTGISKMVARFKPVGVIKG